MGNIGANGSQRDYGDGTTQNFPSYTSPRKTTIHIRNISNNDIYVSIQAQGNAHSDNYKIEKGQDLHEERDYGGVFVDVTINNGRATVWSN